MQNIKSGYDKNGRYIIGTYEEIQNIQIAMYQTLKELAFLINHFNSL